MSELNRQDIITTGRLLTVELYGEIYNKSHPEAKEKAKLRFKESGTDFLTLWKKHNEEKLLYCAKVWAEATNSPLPENITDLENRSFILRESGFLTALEDIEKEIHLPLIEQLLATVE